MSKARLAFSIVVIPPTHPRCVRWVSYQTYLFPPTHPLDCAFDNVMLYTGKFPKVQVTEMSLLPLWCGICAIQGEVSGGKKITLSGIVFSAKGLIMRIITFEAPMGLKYAFIIDDDDFFPVIGSWSLYPTTVLWDALVPF